MKALPIHSVLWTIGLTIAILAIVLILELLYIKFNGGSVPVPEIPRKAETYGSGPPLTLAVLGDSTSVSQGGTYDSGMARTSARFLARERTVTLHNFGRSGARTADLLRDQIPKAVSIAPDVALLSVTANDVTHLTSIEAVRRDLRQAIGDLRTANPLMTILVTGAPAMGSIPRFPEPIKSAARLRTDSMNRMVRQLAGEQSVIFIPIADKTGKAFLEQPSLFAADKFHPNTAGYQLWNDVIVEKLDSIQKHQ